ncbi:MAG: VanZ family protein [Thiobacillus sp.]|nr:VanZ family protein [Thiobacillus sp.]
MAQARQKRAAQWTRIWLACGWAGVIITLVLSLMPPTLGNGTTQVDKLVHLVGYAVLTYWWAQLVIYQRGKLAIAVVLLGVVIEGLQGLTPDRQPDVLDALANTTGVLLGWMIARHTPNLPGRLAALHASNR